MTKLITLALAAGFTLGLLTTTQAQAALSGDRISSTQVWINGIYTTDDDTCRTNLIPTMPVVRDSVAVDLATAPLLATGPVASPLRCVVVLIANKTRLTFKPGPYRGDDVWCDGGGEVDMPLCAPGTTPTFAGSLTADIRAAGLNPHSGVCAASETNIIPLYFSSLSNCRGQVTADGGNTACSGVSSTINAFAFPSAAVKTNGLKLDETAVEASSFKFSINADQALYGNATQRRCESSGNGLLLSFKAN